MCNLYNITSTQDAIRGLAKTFDDLIGNLEPSLDVYPGRNGPVVRNFEGRRQLAMLNWGMPTSAIRQARSGVHCLDGGRRDALANSRKARQR